jgi:hypothetical protein
VGAAVAVTFGLGGLDFASATVATGVRSVFVPVVPCRLFDTRPAPSTVGGRSTPILKDEQFQVPVRGPQGNCNVSGGATAVVLNVTALDAKGDGFLTVWPAENALPTTSNLNFSNGQAPVANAVTVKIDSQGAIKFVSSARSLNVIADVVGFFEDHNHADAYKPGGTVLGTSVVPTVPGTTTTPTTAAPTYDVPNTGDATTNGNKLRAFLADKSYRTVTLAPGDYNIGDQPLDVPFGITLRGKASNETTIIGNSPLPLSRPLITLSKNSTLINVGVFGRSGGAGVQTNTVLGDTAYITNVSINVSTDPLANGAVFNNGSGTLQMTNVRTRSRFGVNNGEYNGLQTGSIVITSSDVDGVAQNAPGGSISVTDSVIGKFVSPELPLPVSGATAYFSGQIFLTRVKIYSSAVGIYAVNTGSLIDVLNSQIFSNAPRQADLTGNTVCNGVINGVGAPLSLACT